MPAVHAGVHGAVYNVRINLGEINDQAWVKDTRSQLAALTDEADKIMSEIREALDARLD